MALIAGDWEIDRSTKQFTYTGADHDGAATYATVIEFHRWAQSLADNAVAIASSDDELDITNTDPSRRSTDNIITLLNGYTLNDGTGTPASEHLYDGSIIQDDGETIYDGIVNFGNADVVIQIIQDGAILSDDWWNLTGPVGVNPDANAGISHRFMVKTREDGVDIDGRRLIGTTRVMDTGAGTDHKTFSEFKINGTSRGNNVLALVNSGDLNNASTETAISGWTNITNTEGLNLIDVNADGSDEEYYSQWTDDDTPDRSQNDYYERLKWLTRDGTASTVHGMNGEVFRGITHSFAYSGAGWDPLTNDTGVWGTYVNVGTITGSFTVGEVIFDGVTDVGGSAYLGRILAVDATDESMILYLESGVTIGNGATIEGVSSGATATTAADPTEVVGGGAFVCLAVDDDGATGNLYVQVTRGTAPPNGATIYESTDLTASLTLTSASTSRTVQTPFIGASTGSNIIGAYGVGFATADINNSDVLTALDDNQYSRPNLVTNTVGGLNTTDGDGDRVLVATWDTDSADVGNGVGYDLNGDPTIDKGQLLLSTALTADDAATVVVKTGSEAAIPADTPTSGTIRVTDDNGFERWIPYSSWTGTTFTINTGHADIGSNNDFGGVDGSGTYQASVDNFVYITYLDVNATAATHAYEGTYVSDRSLVALVRNGDNTAPIKQFIAEWTFKSTNQTLNAIRTTDL